LKKPDPLNTAPFKHPYSPQFASLAVMVVCVPLAPVCPAELATDPSQLGKIAHYGFDAILISAFLAGVKRSTGLTYDFPPDTIFATSPRETLHCLV
jgi:hypothetical protein